MSQNRRERRLAAKQAKKAGSGEVSARFESPAVEAAVSAAVRYRDNGQSTEALQLCAQALRLEPGNPGIHFVRATVHEGTRNWQQAITCYDQAIALDPGFVAALCNCATCHAELLHYPESLALLKRAKTLDQKLLIIDKLMGDVYAATKQHSKAIAHYQRALSSATTLPGLSALASAYDQAGKADKAIETYRLSLQHGASAAQVFTSMAMIEEVRGNVAGAKDYLDRALRSDPDHPPAHLMLATSGSDDQTLLRLKATFAALERLTAGRGETAHVAPLHFAMFNLLDRDGDVDRAFHHLSRGNTLMSDDSTTSANDRLELINSIKAVYTDAFMQQNEQTGDEDFAPVFVFGMPRSGTTLVEQIISNHPGARSVGEIDALNWSLSLLLEPSKDKFAEVASCYKGALGVGSTSPVRVVDKSLGYYLLVGPILCMFPRAQFICCHRHPVDTCASIYSHMFDTVSMPFSQSMPAIAEHYVMFQDMMQYWRQISPSSIHDVYYEQLVGEPEPVARQLVSQLGLEWDDACMNFHQSGATVRTASMMQVRQPIYTSALTRWNRYAEHFKPLKNALAEQISLYEKQSFMAG